MPPAASQQTLLRTAATAVHSLFLLPQLQGGPRAWPSYAERMPATSCAMRLTSQPSSRLSSRKSSARSSLRSSASHAPLGAAHVLAPAPPSAAAADGVHPRSSSPWADKLLGELSGCQGAINPIS